MKTFTHINKTMTQIIFLTFILLTFSCISTQNPNKTTDSINPDGTANTSISEEAMASKNLDGTIIRSNPVGTMDIADRRGTMGTSNRGVTMDPSYENNDINAHLNEQDQDRPFLASAAEANLKQIQAGQLAQQNGQTEDVRDLGKLLENAHIQLQQDLTALAELKRMSLPTSTNETSQDDFNELMNQSNDDFDKAYTHMMINVYEDSIEAVEQASNTSEDADVRHWAAVTLPNLRKHLNRSLECQNKLSTMTLNKN